MDEDKAIEITSKFILSQFPKKCPRCNRIYPNLADFLRNTSHIGDPMPYDAEGLRWVRTKPLGVVACANCQCGNTLAVTSKGMNLITYWRLMIWATRQSRKLDIPMSQLLRYIRTEIDRKALNDDNTAVNHGSLND